MSPSITNWTPTRFVVLNPEAVSTTAPLTGGNWDAVTIKPVEGGGGAAGTGVPSRYEPINHELDAHEVCGTEPRGGQHDGAADRRELGCSDHKTSGRWRRRCRLRGHRDREAGCGDDQRDGKVEPAPIGR